MVICVLCGFLNIPDTIYRGVYNAQKKVIGDRIFKEVDSNEFKYVSGKYSTIYYTENGEDYVNMILSATDMYYPIIANEFNYNIDEKVNVIIYNDIKMFGNILKIGGGAVPMGAYYGGVLNILSPDLWINKKNDFEVKDDFIDQGPMVHEIVHLVLDRKLTGKYSLWFTEGMALYYENKYTGFEWRSDLIEKSKSLTLEQLENKFSLLDEGLSYRRSYDIINNIVNEYGEEKLDKIVEMMADGKSFRYCIEEVLGETR